jgi:hypothetical protein
MGVAGDCGSGGSRRQSAGPTNRKRIEATRRREQANEVTLIAPRVQGFVVDPYLALPYYQVDVAAPGRWRVMRMGSRGRSQACR